jgi:hypothetical protein
MEGRKNARPRTNRETAPFCCMRFGVFSRPGSAINMADRKTTERRKNARGARVDVKRAEFEQLKALVINLGERVGQLQRQLEEVRRKIRPL